MQIQGNLLELKTNMLLEKFGAGNHKPGSGSAIALHGILSAQLVRTVIDLTKARKDYQPFIFELLKIEAEINKIYPELEKLLHDDAVYFDKVIGLRRAREKEDDDLALKCQLKVDALEALKVAVEIPIQIANLCVKLTEFAIVVFDDGFKSARGDSGVAMNVSVALIAGCLSIIDLNLLSFTSDKWTEKIEVEADRLRVLHSKLSVEVAKRQLVLKEEVNRTKLFYTEINDLLSNIPPETKLSNRAIENVAIRLQRILWKHRHFVWKKDTPENPIDILSPEDALRKLGYHFQRTLTLGQNLDERGNIEVAGVIDKQHKYVAVSGQFPPETQNFTVAHELGHALLHKQTLLFRDGPLDGSSMTGSSVEYQANKFASYFLMPTIQIKKVFQQLFLYEKFIINEQTAFALTASSSSDLRNKLKNLHSLSRFLAGVEYFNHKPFASISKQFGVSVEAMAIRLEELNLVEF